MQKAHEFERSPATLASHAPRRRSVTAPLFLLTLGVIYPGFLCLIFLTPELFEQTFNAASGYVITGIALTLLGLCFALATAHFRAADRLSGEIHDTPSSAPSTSTQET